MDPNTQNLRVKVTPALYAELCAEAWECEMRLDDYVRGLLQRRGKWARYVGTQGGYDLQAPLPPRKGTRAKREKAWER